MAKGPDGQILALFLLESAIGAALAIERIKVVDIELRAGEWPCEVTALVGAEKVPVAEVKLRRRLQVRVRVQANQTGAETDMPRIITYHLEGKKPSSVDS